MRNPRRLYVISGLMLSALVMSSCGLVSRSTIGLPVDSQRAAAFRGVQEELFRAHEQWQGTPYVLGGSDVNGVDCSSYIQIVFGDYFGIEMPRHTSDQLQTGRGVRRTALKPGDLVFFRTGDDLLHVGVVISRNEFMHASTSSGVMISGLGERYWATRYLAARRIL